jgi:hypothetical protein
MGWTAPRSKNDLKGKRWNHRTLNEKDPYMQVTTLGVNLAKIVFRLHGCYSNGRTVLRKQLAHLGGNKGVCDSALLGARDGEG